MMTQGACYAEAARWSAVAVEHGDAAVLDSDECRRICARHTECEVWTLVDSRCELKRALKGQGFKPLVGASSGDGSNDVLVSGSASCSVEGAGALMPFPSGLDKVEEVIIEESVAGCVDVDRAFGSHALGSCSDATLLAVHTSEDILSRAGQYGWFDDLKVSDRVATGFDCDNSKCRTPDGQGGYDCWGDGKMEPYTCTDGFEAQMTGREFLELFFEFQCCKPRNMTSAWCAKICQAETECVGWSLDHGACLVFGNTENDCEPKISTEPRPGVVSGLASCQLKDLIPNAAEKEAQSWYTTCTTPRCTAPVTVGSFFAGVCRSVAES